MRVVFCNRKNTVYGPAIFIDRDGVINSRRVNDYVLDWSQFVFVPGIRNALKKLSLLRLPLIVISNQAAVGKGLLRPAALEEITIRLNDELATDGTTVIAYYYCIHKSNDGCDCRKPRPGMLRRAADDFNIDLRRSVFIGDSETDVQAARAAGCQPLLFSAELSSHFGLPEWAENVTIARTAEELFAQAAVCLGTAARAAVGSEAV